MSNCLSTALYEKTYKHFIDHDKLSDWVIKLGQNNIDEIIVMFNNISDYGKSLCLDYLNGLDFDVKYYDSEKFTDQVIERFNLDENYPSSKEFYYSIANFTQLLVSKSDYVTYICEDISLCHFSENFIEDSIDLIKKNDSCIVTSLDWTQIGHNFLHKGYNADGFHLEHDCYSDAEYEQIRLSKTYNRNFLESDKFWATDGMSDHFYFGSKDKLLSVDYNSRHPIPDYRYPKYSGDSFDKRLNSYMWNNNLLRYVSKKYHYSHIGWPLYLKTIS